MEETANKLTDAMADFVYASTLFAGRQAVSVFLRGDLAAPFRQTAALLSHVASLLGGQSQCGGCGAAGASPQTSSPQSPAPAGTGWGPIPSDE